MRATALPARSPKPARPLRHGVVFWAVRRDGSVLLRRRAEEGLLGGMMEFPSTDWRARPWGPAEALASAPLSAKWMALPGLVRHGFTHFQLELAVMSGVGTTEGLWSPVERLGDHALPTLMKKVARHAIATFATHPYGSATSSAARSGGSPSAASLTGANESR